MRLRAPLQLRATKSADAQQTLLHLLVESMQREAGDDAHFAQRDFMHLEAACRVDQADLGRQIAQFENSIKQVRLSLHISKQ